MEKVVDVIDDMIERLKGLARVTTEKQQREVLSIMKSLTKKAASETKDKLFGYFKDPAQPLEFRILLGDLATSIPSRSSQDVLLGVLEDETQEERIRSRCAYYLGLIGDENAVLHLAEIIDKKKFPEAVRQEAASGIMAYCASNQLSPVVRKELLQVLSSAAQKSGEIIRLRAVRALGYMKHEDSLDTLLKSLDGTPDIRRQAIIGLKTIPNVKKMKAVKRLTSLLGGDPYNAAVIVEALGVFRDPDAAPALTEALGTADDYLKAKIASALAEIGHGPAADSLRSAYHKAKDDEAKRVIKKAYRTLTKKDLD